MTHSGTSVLFHCGTKDDSHDQLVAKGQEQKVFWDPSQNENQESLQNFSWLGFLELQQHAVASKAHMLLKFTNNF